MSRNRNKEAEAIDSTETPNVSPAACSEDNAIAVLQAAEFCLQTDAEQSERVDASETLPAVRELSVAQDLAMSPAIRALWAAVLPLVGTHASRPGEFPGVFKVEAGGGEDEALIYLDVPAKPYQRGERGDMDRVLALSVKLEHDYRRLGGRYYCIDCESPSEETRH